MTWRFEGWARKQVFRKSGALGRCHEVAGPEVYLIRGRFKIGAVVAKEFRAGVQTDEGTFAPTSSKYIVNIFPPLSLVYQLSILTANLWLRSSTRSSDEVRTCSDDYNSSSGSRTYLWWQYNTLLSDLLPGTGGLRAVKRRLGEFGGATQPSAMFGWTTSARWKQVVRTWGWLTLKSQQVTKLVWRSNGTLPHHMRNSLTMRRNYNTTSRWPIGYSLGWWSSFGRYQETTWFESHWTLFTRSFNYATRVIGGYYLGEWLEIYRSLGVWQENAKMDRPMETSTVLPAVTQFPFSEIASGGGNGAQSSSDSTWRQRWFLGCGPEAGDVRFDPDVDQGARSRQSYSLASRGMLARQHYSGTNVSLDFVQKLASGPMLDAQLQWECFKVTKESTVVYTWTTSSWWTPSTRRRRISLYLKKKTTLLLLEEFWSNQHLYIPKLVYQSWKWEESMVCHIMLLWSLIARSMIGNLEGWLVIPQRFSDHLLVWFCT